MVNYAYIIILLKTFDCIDEFIADCSLPQQAYATQILKRVLLFNNASQYPIAPFLYVYLLVFAACWPVLELLPDKFVNSVLLLLVLASWLKKLSWPSV